MTQHRSLRHAERCLTCIFAFICGFGIARHIYITFVSPSVLFEKCAAQSLRGWPSLCEFATVLTPPAPSRLHLRCWAMADTAEAYMSTSSTLLLFSSSSLFSSHSSCSCSSVVEAAVVCSLTSFGSTHIPQCVNDSFSRNHTQTHIHPHKYLVFLFPHFSLNLAFAHTNWCVSLSN